MPYSIITKDGIKINNIPDDVPRDSQVLKDRVAAARSQRKQAEQPAEPSGMSPTQFANQIVSDEYTRRVQRAFEQPIQEKPSALIEGEGLFDRFARKFQEARQLESQMQGGALGAAVSPLESALRPAAEFGLAAVAAPVAGLVGQGVGTLAGGVQALTQGLEPGTEAYNRQVAASAMAGMQRGAEMLSPPPADTIGQRAARAVQEAMSPLPPVGSTTMPRPIRGPRPEAGMEVSDVPTYGPPVMGPPIPPTAVEATKALLAAEGRGAEDLARLQTMGGIDPRVIRAQQELGMQPEIGVSMTGPAQEVVKAIAEPYTVAGKRIEEQKNKVFANLERLSADLGVSRDLSRVRADVADRMLTTQNDLYKLSKNQYQILEGMVPANQKVEASNLLAFLNEEFVKRGKKPADMPPGLEQLRQKFKPKIKLNADGTRSIDLPTYTVLDDVRKDLNVQKYAKESPYANLDKGLRDKLIAALSEDQRVAVQRYGKAGALELFDDARSTVQRRKRLEDDIQELFGEQVNSNEIVGNFTGRLTTKLQNLSKGDYAKFNEMVKLIPENLRRNAVSTAILDNIAAKPEDFIPWFEGTMRNSYARRAFMQNTEPELRKKISSAYRVAKAFERYNNLVPSDRIEGAAAKADNLAVNILSRAVPRAAELGVSGGRRQAGLIQIITSAFFPEARERQELYKAQDFIASDDFKRLMLGLSTPGEVAAIKRAAKSRKFNSYADSVGLPKDQYQRRLWLLNAMQAGAIQQQQLEQQQQMPAMAQ